MRDWKSARAAFMFVIIDPTLPTIVAKMRTPEEGGSERRGDSERAVLPIRKLRTTKRYSTSVSGVGTSPIVVSVRVDQ